jgi:hypothetical protein
LKRSNAGIMGSYPALGMYVRAFLSCVVLFRWTPFDGTIPPSKETYLNVRMDSQFQKLIVNRNRPEDLTRVTNNFLQQEVMDTE